MLFIPKESLQILAVVANAMSKHTFAIVGPSKYQVENQEIATGVGVKWKGQYLILTAGHVVDYCQEDTLRFFWPTRDIQFAGQDPRRTMDAELRSLFELREAKPHVFADSADLAAIILPPQSGAAQDCFALLDERATMPAVGTQVGVFGYPGVWQDRSAKITWPRRSIFLTRSTRMELCADTNPFRIL